jgi:hypothetical protein
MACWNWHPSAARRRAVVCRGGPVMGLLAGVGVGGTVGALIGAFAGMRLPEYEAKRYAGRMKQGGQLDADSGMVTVSQVFPIRRNDRAGYRVVVGIRREPPLLQFSRAGRSATHGEPSDAKCNQERD